LRLCSFRTALCVFGAFPRLAGCSGPLFTFFATTRFFIFGSMHCLTTRTSSSTRFPTPIKHGIAVPMARARLVGLHNLHDDCRWRRELFDFSTARGPLVRRDSSSSVWIRRFSLFPPTFNLRMDSACSSSLEFLATPEVLRRFIHFCE